eukprot:4323787-Amphidinium_carterae.1
MGSISSSCSMLRRDVVMWRGQVCSPCARFDREWLGTELDARPRTKGLAMPQSDKRLWRMYSSGVWLEHPPIHAEATYVLRFFLLRTSVGAKGFTLQA